MAMNRDKRRNESGANDDLDERVVFVNRCAKTVKGGRRMSFSAVIVVGDHEGKVGVGFGKANEVSDAIRKGGEAARKSMHAVTLRKEMIGDKLAGITVPHDVTGDCDGGRVLLKPAPRYRSDRRRRHAPRPRGGRHPRRGRQVARLQEPPERGQGHARRALEAPLRRGDRGDSRVGLKGRGNPGSPAPLQLG